MRFEWMEFVAERDGRQMVDILNAVAEREGTNGFYRSLSESEGLTLVEHLNQAIRRGDCHQLFAREPERGAVASIATLESIKIQARSHTVELKRMATAPAFRGAAGGRFLLDGWRVVLDRCRELGYEIINIDVSEDGPHQLWERMGFKTYAKIADYARVGTRRLDGYFMSIYVDAAYARLAELKRAVDGAVTPRTDGL
jgi:GNAT superfamily N-acetyltransferase